eukprot:3752147-Heterocapsa_arctica.AAC.1
MRGGTSNGRGAPGSEPCSQVGDAGDQKEAVHVPGDESGSGLAVGCEVLFIGGKCCGRAPRDH